MAPSRVGIVGATGETGSSIVNGLLASPKTFSIIALTRPESLTKKSTTNLQAQGESRIVGDGNVLSGLTDVRDIGKYVAEIVLDERTLNKYIFAFNELWSQNQVYEYWEKLSREKLEWSYISGSDLLARIEGVGEVDPQTDFKAAIFKVSSQCMYNWGVRRDNTPEYAKYLGYLTAKELYPDFESVTYSGFAEEVLAGKGKTVYNEKRDKLEAALQQESRKNSISRHIARIWLISLQALPPSDVDSAQFIILVHCNDTGLACLPGLAIAEMWYLKECRQSCDI